MSGANLETKVLQGSIIFLMISALFMTTVLCTSFNNEDQTNTINGTSILSNTEKHNELIKTWYDMEQGAYDIPEWIYPVDLKLKDETAQIDEDIEAYQKEKNNS
jgi:YbbR domain-containing protein